MMFISPLSLHFNVLPPPRPGLTVFTYQVSVIKIASPGPPIIVPATQTRQVNSLSLVNQPQPSPLIGSFVNSTDKLSSCSVSPIHQYHMKLSHNPAVAAPGQLSARSSLHLQVSKITPAPACQHVLINTERSLTS